jgi:hypothetical protein
VIDPIPPPLQGGGIFFSWQHGSRATLFAVSDIYDIIDFTSAGS